MTGQQKKVVTALSLIIVVAVAVLLAWLTFDVITGRVGGDHGSGRVFMLTVANWSGLASSLKGLGAVLSIGFAALGAYKLKDWLFYAIIGCAGVGGSCSIYLYVELSSVETAKSFWAFSPLQILQDYDSFVSAAKLGLGFAIGWFVSVLLAELGIKKFASS